MYESSMIQSVLYNVGIYCRLSLDDGSLRESGSIQTQIMMLRLICIIVNLDIIIQSGVDG